MGSADSPACELVFERMADAGVYIDDDPRTTSAVVEITNRLDGLPLALELAAARCRTLGPIEVAERLRDELGLVSDRLRPEPRHRTLDAVLAWSYDLLDPNEQALLRYLSMFAGGFLSDVFGTAV